MLASHLHKKRIDNLLLEQDRTETGIESTDTLVLQHLAEASNKTIGICWLRNETDTGGLERAESDISKELGETCRGEVDGCAVVGGGLVSEEVDGLLLEQLISSKLECALKEVTSSSWTESSQQSTGTLLGDNLSESSDQTLVVCGRVELYSCLDAIREITSVGNFLIAQMAQAIAADGRLHSDLHIDGCEATVGDRTADCTSQGESGVELKTAELLGGVGGDLLDDGIDLRRASGCCGRGHCIICMCGCVGAREAIRRMK